ncbi:MAG: polysaccharide deacetylase family protein [Clostridia bacterium]|nr:polysaccharide deacetylase family protein [Clostridia bacterium]
MGQIIRMRWPEGRLHAFTMSYDDGRMEDFRLASLMRRYGVKGTFNINTGLYWAEDRPDPEDRPNHRKMRHSEMVRFVEEYRDMAEIAVHARTHRNLATLVFPQIIDELITDRAAIEEDFGVICRGMAYPYGAENADVQRALEACGLVYGRATKPTKGFSLPENWLCLCPTCRHAAPELFSLLDEFLARKETDAERPLLFYLWGHSYELDDDDQWDRMEDFLSRMGGRPEVWYATNIEIYDYAQAFGNLIWSVKGKRVTNPGAIPVFLMNYGSSSDTGTLYRIDPGATVEIV